MAVLDSSKAQDKLNEIRRILAEKVPEAVVAASIDVQKQIQANSPTHEQEYDELMVGSGETSSVPLVGDRSGDTDGRTRLQKEPGSWLFDVVVNPLNRDIQSRESTTTFRIGKKAFLESSTYFTYINLQGKEKNEITHEVGPYFDDFEYGGIDIRRVPRYVAADGRTYKLKPDETTRLTEMLKPIAARYAYAPEILWPVFRQSLVEQLNSLVT